MVTVTRLDYWTKMRSLVVEVRGSLRGQRLNCDFEYSSVMRAVYLTNSQVKKLKLVEKS